MSFRSTERCLFAAALGLAVAVLLPTAQGQIVFQDGFTNAANWTVLASSSDTQATFNYDYGANDAIPAAPNGSDRIGLKLEANLSDPTGAEELAVIPASFTPSGNYRIQVDAWGNYGVGSAFTTEFPGLFAGNDGVTAGRNGAGFLYTGDGGASRDYRLYKNAGEQFFASGQYNPDIGAAGVCDPTDPNTGDCRDNAEPFWAQSIPGFDVGLGLDPDDGQGPLQLGFQPDGTGGFQWMTLRIDVFPTTVGVGITSDPGIAEVRMFVQGDPANPNVPPIELLIGTIDNSNGGDVVNMTGKPAVVYSDLFSSVSDTPQFSFGVFDNFVVEQLPGGAPTGDFNNDTLWNCDDINALSAAIAAGSSDLSFDMNQDGVVTRADITDATVGWLAVGGANNPGVTNGNAFLDGDANLSGAVDGSDFGIWNTNKFSASSAWCDGDFNASGGVDGSDFGIWNTSKFQSSDGVSAVPEPATWFVLLLALMTTACWRR